MKRLLAALLVGSTLGAATLGAAATLTHDGGVVQAGAGEIQKCAPGGLTFEYTAGPGRRWSAITVKGITAACGNTSPTGPIRVELTMRHGDTLIAQGTSACIAPSPAIEIVLSDPIKHVEAKKTPHVMASVEITNCQ